MRTLPTQLTTALESGSFTPVFRINQYYATSFVRSVDVISFEINDVECKASFHTTTPQEDFNKFTIERGVIIDNIEYTISTSTMYATRGNWENEIEYIEGQLFPKEYLQIPADITYQELIETVCALYDKHPIFVNPSASYLNYQFYPNGRILKLSNASKLFTILKQKYLIYGTDNGNEEILFFHVYDRTLNSPMYDVESPNNSISVFDFISRRYVSRDENGTVHITSGGNAPFYNLGFLKSTASHPPYTFSPKKQHQPSKVATHLKYQSGDKIRLIQADNPSVTSILDPISVREVLDISKSPAWTCALDQIEFFSNTEGGSISGNIEEASPFIPLNTTEFNNLLSETDNNIQTALETLNKHTHPLIAQELANIIQLAVLKNPPADADSFLINDVAGGNVPKRVSFTVQRAYNRALFDTLYINITGWQSVSQTWTFASADDPVYQIYVSGNITSNVDYKLGNKIKCTNNSTTFYGYIVKVGAYDSGNNRTPVDVYGGSDYDLANSAITNTFISKVISPDGFPLDRAKWDREITNTSNTAQASPTAGTVYNIGSLSISVPIGLWELGFSVTVWNDVSSEASVHAALSTANNSVSDNRLRGFSIARGNTIVGNTLQARKSNVPITSKTTYYLVEITGATGVTNLRIRGDITLTLLYAKFLYF